MSFLSPAPDSLQAYTSEAIEQARATAKRGGVVALISTFLFVVLTTAVAALALSDGVNGAGLSLWLRTGMSLALLTFFIGSHVWMLAPFSYRKETNRWRLEQVRRLSLMVPEVAEMLREVDRQHRTVLRGEVDHILRAHRHLRNAHAPRMRLA